MIRIRVLVTSSRPNGLLYRMQYCAGNRLCKKIVRVRKICFFSGVKRVFSIRGHADAGERTGDSFSTRGILRPGDLQRNNTLFWPM